MRYEAQHVRSVSPDFRCESRECAVSRVTCALNRATCAMRRNTCALYRPTSAVSRVICALSPATSAVSCPTSAVSRAISTVSPVTSVGSRSTSAVSRASSVVNHVASTVSCANSAAERLLLPKDLRYRKRVLFLSCVASGERGALANLDLERADARRREAFWLFFKMAALHLSTLQVDSLKVICC